MAKRKTNEQFLQDVYDRLGPTYEVLEPYPGGHGKVLMRHLDCGNTFKKNVHDIITKSSGCPYCNGSKPALYNEQWAIENTPLPYHYIKDYVNMTTKCLFHCDKCGDDFLQTPKRIINEHIYGCSCCPTKLLTHEDFLAQLGKECLEEYEILEQYINTDTKIKFRHKTCGTIFKQTPYKFLHRHNKKYCPICYYKKSHGEIQIDTFLEKERIDYQREFIFPDLPNRKFDFYLPNLKVAIEFDGEQHFQYIPFLHSHDYSRFEAQQQRDKEKNQYCLKNNIMLLRIPYYEIDNLFNILEEIFKEKRSETIEKYRVYEVEQSQS